MAMRLKESLLNCYECRKTSTSKEVEIVTLDGKKDLVCPHRDIETSRSTSSLVSMI